MELMIAVVVAGILASIAYPSLMSFIQRSRRADAVAVLTNVVQAQERYRSNKSSYAESFSDLKMGDTAGETAGKLYTKYYDFDLAGVSESFVTGYQVTAKPRTGSAQARDVSNCATLSVKLEGGKLSYLATDSSKNDTSATCWSR